MEKNFLSNLNEEDQLKNILEDAFEAALKKEVFIIVEMHDGKNIFVNNMYIPQVGYYKLEYKKRGMIPPSRGFSIFTNEYTLIEVKNSVSKIKAQDTLKIFPRDIDEEFATDDKISASQRLEFALKTFFEMLDKYLPGAKSKNFTCSKLQTKIDPQTLYPYLELGIDFK